MSDLSDTADAPSTIVTAKGTQAAWAAAIQLRNRQLVARQCGGLDMNDERDILINDVAILAIAVGRLTRVVVCLEQRIEELESAAKVKL